MTPIEMIHGLRWADIPSEARHQARRCLMDTLGVGAGGLGTDLSAMIRDHAAESFGGPARVMFDGRAASASGVALAAGMTIDALDGHDGYNPAKGHVGAPLVAGLLGLAQLGDLSGEELLLAVVLGYEIGCRVAVAQHGTAPDYHTSGSWGATTVAAVGARLMGLTQDQTRHAMGIAEYHGPRSQMMRCIDHPTMLKDGAGWGAMAGVSAVQLAQRGFTGAPAITVENAPGYWEDLGQRWLILEQYFKPYPVCRWAQAPVEGVLALAHQHGLSAKNVTRIEVESFHEAIRLATNRPQTTEEAQYSTSFPCAVALVKGRIAPEDLRGDALHHPEVQRLSQSLTMRESDWANDKFPQERHARVTLHLRGGGCVTGDWMTPRWDATDPPTDAELTDKFHALADPALGRERAIQIRDTCEKLEHHRGRDLIDLLCAPAPAERT